MGLNSGAKNEILPFAAAAGANVVAQAAYANDAARSAGNQSGLARSAFLNKIWRQSAHVAAGLSQWIANRYTPGVLDNGNLDAVEAGMTAAVQQCMQWQLLAMTWNASADYARQTLVIGSNGKIYVWRAPSGPGIGGVGAKDPTNTANAAYWLDYAATITPQASPLDSLFIGSPIYQSTTTLPVNCMWPDGSLALFADWPQFAAKYRANGFAGMVDSSANSANLGKFVLNSNGTGLYLPRCGGQFMRGWCPGQTVDAGRQAGSWQMNEFKSHLHAGGGNPNTVWCNSGGGSSVMHAGTSGTALTGGVETRPDNTAQPIAIYMGTHA